MQPQVLALAASHFKGPAEPDVKRHCLLFGHGRTPVSSERCAFVYFFAEHHDGRKSMDLFKQDLHPDYRQSCNITAEATGCVQTPALRHQEDSPSTHSNQINAEPLLRLEIDNLCMYQVSKCTGQTPVHYPQASEMLCGCAAMVISGSSCSHVLGAAVITS